MLIGGVFKAACSVVTPVMQQMRMELVCDLSGMVGRVMIYSLSI